MGVQSVGTAGVRRASAVTTLVARSLRRPATRWLSGLKAFNRLCEENIAYGSSSSRTIVRRTGLVTASAKTPLTRRSTNTSVGRSRMNRKFASGRVERFLPVFYSLSNQLLNLQTSNLEFPILPDNHLQLFLSHFNSYRGFQRHLSI